MRLNPSSIRRWPRATRIALPAAVCCCLLLAGVIGGRLHRRAAAGLVSDAARLLADRLGVTVRIRRHHLEGWDRVVLEGVRIEVPGSSAGPLLTAARVRLEAGLSVSEGLVPVAVEVERPRLRLGSDLLPVLRRAFSGAPGRRTSVLAAPRRVPRISVRAGVLAVSEGRPPRDVWEVPLATLVPTGAGTLQGSAELRGGAGTPRFLALAGRPTAGGYTVTVEAPLPVRLDALASPFGRGVAVRALRLQPSGVSFLGVEVGVPHGREIIARLPEVRLGGGGPDGGLRLEIVRPELRLERYADARLDLPPALASASDRSDRAFRLLGGPPALSVRDGRVTFVRYRRDEPPWTFTASHLDLGLTPGLDGYSGTLAWSPGDAGGRLAASGLVAGPEDASLALSLDTLDLPAVARALGAELLGGRGHGDLRLVLDGPVVRAEGEVRADDLGLRWALLSHDAVEGLDLRADFALEWDRDSDEVRLASLALGIGTAELSFWGTLRAPEGTGRYDLHARLGPLPCDDVATSLPVGLRPELPDLRLRGHVALRARAWGRLDDPRTLRLDVGGDVKGFEAVSGGKDIDALAGPFVHSARIPDGSDRLVSVDPTRPGFTPLADIPAALRSAVVASEDMGYWRHNGFDLRQVAAAIARNVRTGRIERGGSTLTQQLAKNLYLRAEKTISRKLQEAYLAWRLEQRLSKARILELYLNVVEWGPDVYGVAEAARYYFGKRPRQLGLRQCAFLAAILPNPTLLGRRDENGQPSQLVSRRIDRIVGRVLAQGRLPGAVAAR